MGGGVIKKYEGQDGSFQPEKNHLQSVTAQAGRREEIMNQEKHVEG